MLHVYSYLLWVEKYSHVDLLLSQSSDFDSIQAFLNLSHLYHQLRLTGADGKGKEKEGEVGEEENDNDGMTTMNFSSHHLCTPLEDHSSILWTIRSASPHSFSSPFLYPPTWSRPNVGIKLIGDASTVPCIIWAHHCILTSRCPYFAALLSTERAMSALSCAI